jgi:hypothetical protein
MITKYTLIPILHLYCIIVLVSIAIGAHYSASRIRLSNLILL